MDTHVSLIDHSIEMLSYNQARTYKAVKYVPFILVVSNKYSLKNAFKEWYNDTSGSISYGGGRKKNEIYGSPSNIILTSFMCALWRLESASIGESRIFQVCAPTLRGGGRRDTILLKFPQNCTKSKTLWSLGAPPSPSSTNALLFGTNVLSFNVSLLNLG